MGDVRGHFEGVCVVWVIGRKRRVWREREEEEGLKYVEKGWDRKG